MITQSSNIQAELVTWKFSGTISSVNDPNGALSSSGVNLNTGAPFTIIWTYDPTIGPTIQNTEVAQWQFGTNRSSMIMDIDSYVWDSDINFNDQVFGNGLNENVVSGFRTDLGSDGSIVLPAGFSSCFTLIPPSIDLPSGLVWGIRLIGPVKGEEFCVHTVTVP